MHPRFRTAILVLLVCAVASCATTRQRRSVETSGFLGDYSQLREGKGDQALLVYFDDSADFAAYKSVVVDPIQIYQSADAAKISEEDAQNLASLLYHHVTTELGKDYTIVPEAGPGTMRLRMAITQASGAAVVTNTITSIIPQTRLLTTLGGMATDTAAMVGSASAEMEIQDSETGTRLAAAVDARAGTKAWRGLGGEWKHVDLAFQHWAERLRTRLAELRGA
jgi:hypothetical protein